MQNIEPEKIFLICATIVLLALCSTIPGCNEREIDSYNKCVQLTQKPLECRYGASK